MTPNSKTTDGNIGVPVTTTDTVEKSVDIVGSETGARHPVGTAGVIVTSLALLWSLFQIYVASTLPFTLSALTGWNLTLNEQAVRQIHLAFALALAMLAFPSTSWSARTSIPVTDWLLAALGAASCLYLFYFRDQISARAGLPTDLDLWIAGIGLLTVAIGLFRSLGPPLLFVAGAFMLYTFAGYSDLLPEVIRWKGASFSKAMWHYWMQSEGVFGVALGVSASMIFLFVLFGALLEKAGAGLYFIRLAFALLGHLRGGPAKAAVLSSGISGIYSGSSIANVVSTGTFTIPLMKRTGLSAEKAGAIEASASSNGQLTPPVMGAAAFLIAEFTGVPYATLIYYAALPAAITYLSLLYIVHLEALKLGLNGLPRPEPRHSALFRWGRTICIVVLIFGLIGLVRLLLSELARSLPAAVPVVAVVILTICYLGLIWLAARRPDLDPDEWAAETLPRAGDVLTTGAYFLLPIIVLIWCILFERLSPTLSALRAIELLVVILVTQKPLKVLLRGSGTAGLRAALCDGARDLRDGLVFGARNMIGIAVATAVAGVIIGSVSLTGMHQVIGSFVEYLAGGSLMLMLLLVAAMSILLGMGLPTTANYIVVSTLMAPVVVSIGAQNGLIVPLVAVHLFVFYFGILADVTPPVGMASFAAAAISGGSPLRTGVQGFLYDIRTALLPFLFIFNTQLLLIDVVWWQAVFISLTATLAMLLFVSATQGWLLIRSRLWESAALLLIAFTLFRPGFWLDLVDPPFETVTGIPILSEAADAAQKASLRLVIMGPDARVPEQIRRQVYLAQLIDSVQDPGSHIESGIETSGIQRLRSAGIAVVVSENQLVLEEPLPGSRAYSALRGFDFYGDANVRLSAIELARDRLPKEIWYIPATALLLMILQIQVRRRRRATLAA
ncbi:TRAP transporter permease [Puniceibacterium sp. IMCC21224]|uniref:TRAP transporter permease n=1 Tax=Puniceibacterium sp. IMCC21224 TaxID=1618204 RepID=UPI00065CFD53|nr:TRAP transporter permease [Puniceibacterium sp. IMCC21224]KMK69041.1 TRAP transporter, 4TM/12TM fusion protein [Puniceibacterium sp. IMCC21224]